MLLEKKLDDRLYYHIRGRLYWKGKNPKFLSDLWWSLHDKVTNRLWFNVVDRLDKVK